MVLHGSWTPSPHSCFVVLGLALSELHPAQNSPLPSPPRKHPLCPGRSASWGHQMCAQCPCEPTRNAWTTSVPSELRASAAVTSDKTSAVSAICNGMKALLRDQSALAVKGIE
eukprot:5623205-Pleurochrysis_carterae.AAC.1